MKAFITLVLATLLDAASASAMITGSCPTFTSNLSPERANHTKMGGLWYEFAYTKDWVEKGQHYECASWNLLANSDYGSFDLLHHSLN